MDCAQGARKLAGMGERVRDTRRAEHVGGDVAAR
jgi:hypothetical protein